MPLHLQRVLVISCVFRGARSGLRVRSFVDREARRPQPGRRDHPAVLRPHRAASAAARQLERRRLRPAGAAAARACATASSPASTGTWADGRPRVPLQQLHRPLPPPPHRPDGPARDVPAARQRAARRDGQAVRLPGQARHGRLAGLSGATSKAGRDEIRRYCETDAMNTYLLWCRFEKMRGRLDEANYAREIAARARGGRGASTSRTGASTWPRGRSKQRRRCGRPRRAAQRPAADAVPDAEPVAACRRRRRFGDESRRDDRDHRDDRSTSIPRASARSRRASPCAGWSCGMWSASAPSMMRSNSERSTPSAASPEGRPRRAIHVADRLGDGVGGVAALAACSPIACAIRSRRRSLTIDAARSR